MRTRLKKVPETTNNITLGIKNFLNSKGHKAVRINTTGVYDPVNDVFRKISDDDKGVSDIIACILGWFVAIEIKFDNDKQSAHQLNFQEEIIEAGGVYIVIRKYEEFTEWYNQFITK